MFIFDILLTFLGPTWLPAERA